MNKPKTITERLAQLEASMDAIANDLEGAGFYAQASALDQAGERIEGVKEEFETVLW
jgi:hypothetical protein